MPPRVNSLYHLRHQVIVFVTMPKKAPATYAAGDLVFSY